MGPIFANYRDTVDMLKKLETVDKNSTNENDFDSLVKNGVIQLEHIGFLRGRSINDSIIIWDEAQNCKKTLSKTIVSRVGMNSRIFILGDPEQIDDSHLSREDNSLSHIVKNLRNESIYAHITLDKCERSAVSKLAGRVL
jgi:PhoH-like ATPase